VPQSTGSKANPDRSDERQEGRMEPTPRDFLANERTFLAYVRTALSFIAFGFVVARFALFTREISVIERTGGPPPAYVSTSLGVAMTIVGVAIGLFGAARYAQQDRALRSARSDGTLSRRGAAVVALSVVVFGAIITFDLLRIP
jgi:putative membrane protein